jgi:hypothetical protein
MSNAKREGTDPRKTQCYFTCLQKLTLESRRECWGKVGAATTGGWEWCAWVRGRGGEREGDAVCVYVCVVLCTEEAAVCLNLSQMAGQLVSWNWETDEFIARTPQSAGPLKRVRVSHERCIY